MTILASAAADAEAVENSSAQAAASAPDAPRVDDMLDPDGVPAQPSVPAVSEKVSNGSSDNGDMKAKGATATPQRKRAWPASLVWIPNNWKWTSAQTVIRCSVVGWLSLVLLMISQVEVAMGIVSVIYFVV
jgi:hypothetical protein